jgi:polyphosphate kinase
MIKTTPEYFLNRELSWLEFNRRVLAEALDSQNPLLERIKFFSIFSSNLDEFFEVRIAGLKQQIESGDAELSNDGLTPQEILQASRRQVLELVEQQNHCWRTDLVPNLEKNGISFLAPGGLDAADAIWMDQFYRAEIQPVLTPLAIDSAHPFPLLQNKSLNLIVQLINPRDQQEPEHLAIVQVPRNLPRLIRLPRPGRRYDYLFLEQVIGQYLNHLFAGMTIQGYWLFRVTRNGELYIDEEEVDNLLKAVEQELHKRRRGEAIRLEVQMGCPGPIKARLLENLRLTAEDLYEIEGPLSPSRLMMLYNECSIPELKFAGFIAPVAAAVRDCDDLFSLIREQDILLHHPYDSFETVIQFMEQAANDPRVLAIKQTLYRTGGDNRIVNALMRAAHNGKQVTAVVELRARFDEANNIEWARRLEEAGVHVVYGLVGYKIHGKICLVVRREESGLRRYLHLSTGNYNPVTARIYTDLGLLTCDPVFGEDATQLFNLLTGLCQYQGMRNFMTAPFELHHQTCALIQREAEHARQGLPARIIAKMNSLVDRDVIMALYQASAAGAKIDLIVRGICCLRPQRPRISRNITVRSIVDRFLEHSRVWYFENACQPEVFVGSADWMPRNFFRRIEIVIPVRSGVLRDRIRQEILEPALEDNVKARILQPDGSYIQLAPAPGEAPVRSQLISLNQAGFQNGLRLSRAASQSKTVRIKLAPRPEILGPKPIPRAKHVRRAKSSPNG